MTDEAREAALAERERIARLADECGARYSRNYEYAYLFSALIRSGAPRAPWFGSGPDPLAVAAET